MLCASTVQCLTVFAKEEALCGPPCVRRLGSRGHLRDQGIQMPLGDAMSSSKYLSQPRENSMQSRTDLIEALPLGFG
jgi:hypothetical protein